MGRPRRPICYKREQRTENSEQRRPDKRATGEALCKAAKPPSYSSYMSYMSYRDA